MQESESKWRTICKGGEEDRPRKLTFGEIEGILSRVKRLQSPFLDAADLAMVNLLDHLGRQLQEIELCPSGIKDMGDLIVSSQVKNICEPGYAMGSTTGSALGSINTQTMLNTFKASGAADTGSRGVEATENLVYARASPKTDFCTVHFHFKRTSLKQALILSYDLDEFTLKDALSDNSVNYFIHKFPIEEDMPEWFHYTMTPSFKVLMTRAAGMLELILDPVKLGIRGIGMPTVVSALFVNGFAVVWSSLREGRLFIIPKIGEQIDEDSIKDIDLLTCYLVKIFIENTSTIYLKGIPGQTASAPTIVKVPSFVTKSQSIGKYDIDYEDAHMPVEQFKSKGGRVFHLEGYDTLMWNGAEAEDEMNCAYDQLGLWKVTVNVSRMRTCGLGLDRIVECMATSKVREVRLGTDYDWSPRMEIECKPNRYKTLLVRSKRCPLSLMNSCMRDLQEDSVVKNDNCMVYVYLTSKGINLGSICSLPFVDSKTSYCINAHVMADMFGIGNAMISHMNTIQNTFDHSNHMFHPSRVQMMCNHITSTGQFHGVDHTGMIKREEGFLTQAALERSAAVLVKHSIGGAEETVDSVSPATILGGTPRLGTGLSSVVYVDSEGSEFVDDAITEEAKKRMIDGLSEGRAMFVDGIAQKDRWVPEAVSQGGQLGGEQPIPKEGAPGLTEEPLETQAAATESTQQGEYTYAPMSPGMVQPEETYTYAPSSPGMPPLTGTVQLGPSPETEPISVSLAMSQQASNAIPEQATHAMKEATEVDNRGNRLNARVEEEAPDEVLVKLANGGDFDKITGDPIVDEEGNPPHKFMVMEELKEVVTKPVGSQNRGREDSQRGFKRARSMSLSDTEIEAVAADMRHEEGAQSDVSSLPDLEGLDDIENLCGTFQPFDYDVNVKDIVEELAKANL